MQLASILFRLCLPAILLALPAALFAKPKDDLPWSFQAPQRPGVPAAGKLKHGATAYRNAIDGFILAALEQRDLEPAPEADRPTLVRRAYFDLLGLPPTPDQARAFIESEDPDAWT